jgi:excisionase family DNA binding protein
MTVLRLKGQAGGPQESNADRLLTPTEVFERLGIRRTLGYQLLESGEIATLRIGRLVRVRPKDLTAWIDSRVSSATGAA